MTISKRDCYEVMGVARGATDEELKKAFRGLVKQYHPDANKEAGAQAQFIEIVGAYEILSDPQKRSLYDRFGYAGFNESGDIRTPAPQPKAQATVSKEATRTAFGLGGIISTFLGFTTGKAAMDAAKQEKAATTDEEKRKSAFLKFSSITATIFFGILSLYAFTNAATTGKLHERLRNMFKNENSV